jgi:hypothetical protein
MDNATLLAWAQRFVRNMKILKPRSNGDCFGGRLGKPDWCLKRSPAFGPLNVELVCTRSANHTGMHMANGLDISDNPLQVWF